MPAYYMIPYMPMDTPAPSRNPNPPRRRTKRKEWLFRLLLLAASGSICLGLLEIAARMVSPPPPFGPYFDLRPYKRLELRPHLPGVAEPGLHTANKWGMRGEDPPEDWDGALTVITVGGSTTQCFFLDDARTWPSLLQAGLRERCGPGAWVGNAGLDGHSTRGHVLLMDKVISKLRPDILVFLVGVNDLALSVSYGDKGSPFDEHLVKRVQGRGPRAFLERSRLVQIAMVWKRVLVDGALVVKEVGHKPFRPKPMDGPEDAVPPADSLPSLREFLRGVDTLARLSRSMGIRPIFLTQPSLFSEDARWESIKGEMSFVRASRWKISAATEYRMLRAFNEGLLRQCAALGVECLDLGAKVPHDSAHFYDDYHFTDRGAKVVAGEVKAFLDTLPGICP